MDPRALAPGAFLEALPRSAAWRHHGLREGFEVVFLSTEPTGHRFDGHTVAVEGGRPWVVGYRIELNERWVTTSARISGWSPDRRTTIDLASDGSGRWLVDGHDAPELFGCVDVDLESSCCTNTIPVHRLQLALGDSAEPPAVYVRAADLRVQRLAQRYSRTYDAQTPRYDYCAPAFEFEASLTYDAAGLVLDYPGIGSRVL